MRPSILLPPFPPAALFLSLPTARRGQENRQGLQASVLPSQFSSVQLLSRVRLFATPWTAACQASLPITNSQSLLKLMSIESVMPSHPLSPPSPPAFSLSQHRGLLASRVTLAPAKPAVGARRKEAWLLLRSVETTMVKATFPGGFLHPQRQRNRGTERVGNLPTDAAGGAAGPALGRAGL